MLRRKLRAMLMSQQNKDKGRIYLYNQGDTCDSVTGGWSVVRGYASNADDRIILDGYYVFFSNLSGSSIRLETNKTINIENKKLCVLTSERYRPRGTYYYLAFSFNAGAISISYNDYNSTMYVKRTEKFDVPGDNENTKISIKADYGEMYIYAIWLEDK